MNNKDKNLDALKQLRVKRIATDGKVKQPVDEEVSVVREAPVTIDVEGIESYTLLSTPTDRCALAVGFLYTEGVIRSMEDIEVLKPCDDDSNTIRVRLHDNVPKIDDAGRNLLIVSSCGACGSENLEKRIDALSPVGDRLKIKASVLRLVFGDLHKRQSLFEQTGGAHAAALFDKEGNIIAFAEDSGRHNALDKVIGICLMDGKSTQGKAVALTSRLSLEMVSRCSRAGIELIAAVSAPTSMAIEVAQNVILHYAPLSGKPARQFSHIPNEY